MTFDGEMVIRRKRANFWSPPRDLGFVSSSDAQPLGNPGTSRNS